ncbi:hypothetical protein [Thomasclavelia cocleata]|uniref:hypothetical protein n=1 Tax=Thomasclavelia cocleata TaxID=69824 RepID=UPI00258FFE21|nr:hypothetical protein [Thomasclavelia cocleata]
MKNSIWVWDAEKKTGNFPDLLVNNDKSKAFLETNNYNGLCATKGIGKTFLIQVKRRNLQKEGNICLPIFKDDYLSDWGLEKISIDPDLCSNFMRGVLKKSDSVKDWCKIWINSILSTALSSFKKINDYIIEERYLRKISLLNTLNLSDNIFKCLLWNRDDYISDSNENHNYKEILSSIISNNDKKVYFFIDRIDQAFDLYDDEFRKNQWVNMQLGLILAVKEIMIPNFNIIYTIREEVLHNLDRVGSQNRKYLDTVLRLQYTQEDQKLMFINYINNETDESKLFSKNDENYAMKFVGFTEIEHPTVKKKEGLFEVLYRHSFDRPRDIQQFGDAISSKIQRLKECSEEERISEVKQIIRDTAITIASNFLIERIEFIEDATIDIINKHLCEFDSNIVSGKWMLQTCRRLNKCETCNFNCAKCLERPIRNLYSLGFLGYVEKDSNTQTFINSQDFSFVNREQTSIERKSQDIEFFLLHPAVTKYIEKLYSKKIYHCHDFIIGKNNPVQITKEMISKFSNKDNPERKNHPQIDVLVFIATEAEFNPIRYFLKQEQKNDYWYEIDNDIKIAYYLLDKMGMLELGIQGQKKINELHPRLIAMIGFCAGNKKTTHLGDLIVPTKIFNYSNGKQLSNDQIMPDLEVLELEENIRRVLTYKTFSLPSDRKTPDEEKCELLEEFLNCEDIDKIDASKYQCYTNLVRSFSHQKLIKYTAEGKNMLTDKGKDELTKLKAELSEPSQFQIHKDTLACGVYVQERDDIFDFFKHNKDRKTVGLDMESFALFRLGNFNDIKSIVVKGVGDYGGRTKKKDNLFVPYASYMSYCLLKEIIKTLYEQKIIKRKKKNKS